MNTKIKIFSVILLLFFTSYSFSQQNEIKDTNYKFKISLPSKLQKTKIEETDKKDAISYSYKTGDGKMFVMILAFKITTIKNLADLIYTIEKDLSLNVPKRSSEYSDYDFGSYDGRSAVYKNNESVEILYYFRTKNDNLADNYAYVLRFISPAAQYNSSVESDIKTIADSFKYPAE
jgi:hypothetical protein